MFRRALLLGAVLAAAVAPSAQAADSKLDPFTVEAVATMVPSQLVATHDGQVTLAVECAVADPTSLYAPAYIYKCAVGRAPYSAGYELCVGAGSFGTGTTDFYRCVPLDPVTGTARISG